MLFTSIVSLVLACPPVCSPTVPALDDCNWGNNVCHVLDWDCDGTIDCKDLNGPEGYIVDFFNHEPCAHFSYNGGSIPIPDDLSDFITYFFTGFFDLCPKPTTCP